MTYKMRSILTAWACFAALSSPSYAAVELLDRIVATVNDDVVTQSELNQRIADIKLRSQAADMRLPPDDVLQEQILQQLIDETLQLNAARRYGVTISDQEVLSAVENLLERNQISDEELERQLALDGSSIDDLKARLRRQLMMQNISQGVVTSRIKISDQDIDNFLKSADAQFWISPDYRLGHILISIPSSADTTQTQAIEEKAQAVYTRLQKGENFANVALAESDGPLALEGGDMGWRKSSELPTLFADIAPELEVGDVSRPARSQAGFHILKLMDKRGETKQIVNQTKARHILIETSAIVNDEQAKEKLNKLRQQIIDGADFAALAKEHSADIGSKLNGGDLGWSSPGQYVPAFEQTMANTEIGQVSEPFQSQFGWHILQVQDRREEDMTDRAIRAKARNILKNRRYEDEVQLWIQEMRDNAFIEIKI